GRRVGRDGTSLTDLVGYERRASIFAAGAADDAESSAKLTALLEFKQDVDASEPNSDVLAKAADEVIKGDDRMRVFGQLDVSDRLLAKKVALTKVVDIAKAATGGVDAGLDVPTASVAVLADELHDPRAIAAARGEYVNVPDVPRATLSAIVRGRIEAVAGWALF